jgi:hypothetical protein
LKGALAPLSFLVIKMYRKKMIEWLNGRASWLVWLVYLECLEQNQ